VLDVFILIEQIFSSSLRKLDNEERVRLFVAMENITCRLSAPRAQHYEASVEYVAIFRIVKKLHFWFDDVTFPSQKLCDTIKIEIC